MDFQERDPPFLPESAQSSKPSSAQQASELWEVVEEPRGRLGTEGVMPERQEGHLLKKRKWPLKGWHKRYFVLEDGILHYATTRQDVSPGSGLGLWEESGPSMPWAGTGYPESTRAGSESQVHHLLNV